MRPFVFRVAVGSVCSLLVYPAFGAERGASNSSKARLESVDGAKTVLLQRGLSLRDASPGDEIQIGERIRTDNKTTVKIAYADGSKLLIHPGSDFEVEKVEKGAQSNLLRSGLVQGEVPKATDFSAAAPGKAAEAPKAKPIRFVIRTKTAVMGVRGTEFVAGFNAAQGVAQFNTLEGTVEVAANSAELAGGHGVAVTGGHAIQATEMGLGPLSGFETAQFMDNVGDFAREMSAGSSEAGSGTVSSRTQARASSEDLAAKGATAEARPPAPVPPPAPAPKLPQAPPPPPPPPAVAEQKKAEAEAEKPRFHLLTFSLAGFFSGSPQAYGEDPSYRALELCWTPTFPVPVLNFLYVRGALGVAVLNNYSMNSSFVMQQIRLYAGTTLLNPLFFEVGAGQQNWRNLGVRSGVVGVNAGVTMNQNGFFNRIYGGVSKFLGGTEPLEIHIGAGFIIL